MPPAPVFYLPAKPRRLGCVSLLAALLFSSHAYAAGITVEDMNADPNMVGGLTMRAVGTETGMWESNPLMLTNGGRALYGSITTPELFINDNTPTDHLHEDLSVVQNIFNQSNFDSTDIHSKFDLDRSTQRWNAGIQQQTDYDTTRTSELSNFNLRTTPVQHLALSFTPQIGFKPNGTDQWSLQGNYLNSTYGSSSFTDYQQYSVSPSFTHNFDELNAGVISLQAQRYQSIKGPKNTVDSFGPTIGWLGTLTPRLTANANVGIQQQRQFGDNVVTQHWSTQYTFSGGVTYKDQQDLTKFTMSRNQYPFGNGTEALLTTFNLTETHAINERLSLNAAGSYQSSDYQANSAGNLDMLASGGGGLTYRVTDHFDFTSNYQFRYETYTGISKAATDHLFLIGIVYHPQAWSL